MSCIKKILILAVLAALGVYLFVWFGFYNVAANEKHWGITTKFLGLALHRSVKFRAIDMPVPDLTDRARIERGAANYDSMCAACHLAPGIETSELQEGMYPQPPVLYKKANFASKPNEDFWIIKNGIKMTGMPSWGLNNSDEQIWDMIALIRALDYMTPEKYQELAASGEHTHKNDMGGHVDEKPHGKEEPQSGSMSNMQKEDVGHVDEVPHGKEEPQSGSMPNMQKDDVGHVDEVPHGKKESQSGSMSNMQKVEDRADAVAEKPDHVDKEGDHPK